MAIKGLATRKARLGLDERGKPIRLGRINKGTRKGWGKQARFEDLDYFRFTPYESDPQTAERMRAIFNEVYGMKPKRLHDVRIFVDIAGNFNVDDCAWLYAHKYGKDKTPVFMARSDGENIKQLRDPANPRKVNFHYDDERPFEEWTVDDESEYGALLWNGKQYKWQQHFKIDLIFTEFNKALYREGVSGHGVVTVQTTSKWDIANLIDEYRAVITDLVDLFQNPLDQGSADRVRNHIPLRSIPLELYRSSDTYTTPSYKTKKNPNPSPDSRFEKESWLLHWRINRQFAEAMHKAQAVKTANMLAAIENLPLLPTGQQRVIAANNDLFGDDEPLAIPAVVEKVVVIDEADDEMIWVEDDHPDPPAPEHRPEPMNWVMVATKADKLTNWASAAFQVEGVKTLLDNAVSVKNWREYYEPDFIPERNELMLNLLTSACQKRADGVSRKATSDWIEAQIMQYEADLAESEGMFDEPKQSSLIGSSNSEAEKNAYN